MKLQKQLSRKVGSKKYAKYVLTIPPNKVEELEWKEGDEINILVKNKKAVLKKSR